MNVTSSVTSPVIQQVGFGWRWFFGPHSEWFWILIQVFVVAGSVWLVISQVRSQRLTNMIEALRDIDKKWTSVELLKARKAVCDSFLGKGNTSGKRLSNFDGLILDFFEDLGVFCTYGAITQEVVWEGYSNVIEHYWLILKPCIYNFRETSKDASWYTKFEALFVKCQEISKKKDKANKKREGTAASDAVPDLGDFAMRELRRVIVMLRLKGVS